MKSIEIENLKKIINPLIIDIRYNYEFQNGNIENSINIPAIKLIRNPYKYLNKENRYYILCSKGNISREVVNNLRELGFDVININGGYNKYLLTK